MASYSLSRRGVLVGAIGSAGGVASCSSLGVGATGLAAASDDGAHEHHEHGEHAMARPAVMDNHLVHALMHCKAASEACLSLCIDMLQTGDPSMADCARRVRETAAICDVSITFIASGSPITSDLLAVCKSSCELCKAECEKHAAHHKECVDCAESCVAVIEAISA